MLKPREEVQSDYQVRLVDVDKFMRLNKSYLLVILLILLGAFYTANVFSINKVSTLLVEKPVKLSFTVIIPVDGQCEKCFDATTVIDLIKESHNIKISNKKILTEGSLSYQRVVEEYGINNLPALIVAGDISDERILGAWTTFKGKEKSDKIVIQDLLPFYDLEEKKIKGLVDVIVIIDGTCKECFDGNQYLEITNRLGMASGGFNIYDITSTLGLEFIQKYGITKVPALLLSPSANDYPGFAPSWGEVGTVEDDGMFVLREVQKIGGGFREI